MKIKPFFGLTRLLTVSINGQVNGIANLEAFKRYQPNAPLNTPTRDIYDNE